MAVDGSIKPIIGGAYDFEDAAEALKSLDERRATGKVVLNITADV